MMRKLDVTSMFAASLLFCYTALVTFISIRGEQLVPDEQRLYQELMIGYEKSVRPVINASNILIVNFGLRLNQIVDLDERHQVLTTNVFIDQKWRDENFFWTPDNHNSIKSLRIPAKNVWLPDTFIYNNADDGSTGFMQGTYVLVDHDGYVLWPVPVKLKSSCKVDITYFPFDDQQCILRFGSWIYSGLWMDYVTMQNDTPVDLSLYVNNSEWDLLSITLSKNIRTHSCCPDPHPDMTYQLHIRRKTFYYIFNIIVPCIMLSVLTLLTFWLPPTSGEKITLGLSVFLAFSMFMLLIAEEVPATSESVPLIGIYLCVVMTLTSVSVIMAVMVINLYNRGMKTRRAPPWIRTLILKWLSKPLFINVDVERVAKSITLEEETEGAYDCKKHLTTKRRSSTVPFSQPNIELDHHPHSQAPSVSGDRSCRNRRYNIVDTKEADSPDEAEETEVVWLRREDVMKEAEERKKNTVATTSFTVTSENQTDKKTKKKSKSSKCLSNQIENVSHISGNVGDGLRKTNPCKTLNELHHRKIVVAEWQRIASVIDRILFWIYFLGTVTAYIIILIVVPGNTYAEWDSKISPEHRSPMS
ncbi:hypothetical protein ScPMuIL_013333 [Solemya velum]